MRCARKIVGLLVLVSLTDLLNEHCALINKILGGSNLCSNTSYYFCSFYFMTAIASSTGIGDFAPRHISEMIVVTVFIICIKFIVAVFLGEMSALVQNFTYSLVNYDHGMLKLKVSVYLHFCFYNLLKRFLKGFLKNNDASEPLIRRVLDYASQLWKIQKGRQVPALLQKAPNFLKEQIKVAAYGHHLFEVTLLLQKKTHDRKSDYF